MEQNMFDAEFMKLLACPWCVTRPEVGKNELSKGELELQGTFEKPQALKCKQCGRVYSFLENGIPNLLVEEAKLPSQSTR
jgi:uncharacterized protein YbaR (Trm112 family)